MKAENALKWAQFAGLVIGGFVLYRVGSAAYKATQTGGQAVGEAIEAAKSVVTKDLNPASDQNLIYKNLPESFTEKVGNFLGGIFGPPMPDTSDISNVSKQAENISMNITATEAAKRKASKDMTLYEITSSETERLLSRYPKPLNFDAAPVAEETPGLGAY